jgi:hypothetical protein
MKQEDNDQTRAGSSSAPVVEEPAIFSSFEEKPGVQEILPYSCEADVFSFAFAFLSSLSIRPLIEVDVTMPFYYKQQFHVRQLFEWHGLWPALIRAFERIEASKTIVAEGTFAEVLASHWRDCFARRLKSVCCPFDSWEEAMRVAPPKSISQRLFELK